MARKVTKCELIRAARAANAELIGLYWKLGKQIAEKQQAAGWGDAVIDQIAGDLTRDFGGLKGFSRANLYRMKRFYGFYGADETVAQLVRQIPWGHNIESSRRSRSPRRPSGTSARPWRTAGRATSWRSRSTAGSTSVSPPAHGSTISPSDCLHPGPTWPARA